MTEVLVPRESVNDDTVIVQKILVASGTIVAAGAPVVEIETSKTNIEMTAPTGGRIIHHLRVGSEVAVGELLFRVNDAQGESQELGGSYAPKRAETAGNDAGSSAAAGMPPLLSRAASAMAARAAADLSRFAGRWVTTDDLREKKGGEFRDEAGLTAKEEEDEGTEVLSHGASRQPRVTVRVAYKEVARSKRKRAEVEILVGGSHESTTSCIGIRIRLPGKRIALAPALFENGIADLIVFEAARLLKQYPELNGFHLNERANGYYDEVNFGISFDNRHNLKVLALTHADKKGLGDIQREFMDLLELYESGKSIPADLLETSTVTLSDLSITDASYMLPLLNGRQSLILGVVRRSRAEFELFASFDHRLSEGLQVARFLEELRDRVISHYLDEQGNAYMSCDICGKSMNDEARLGSRGFVKIVLPSGAEAGVCRNCFEGR